MCAIRIIASSRRRQIHERQFADRDNQHRERPTERAYGLGSMLIGFASDFHQTSLAAQASGSGTASSTSDLRAIGANATSGHSAVFGSGSSGSASRETHRIVLVKVTPRTAHNRMTSNRVGGTVCSLKVSHSSSVSGRFGTCASPLSSDRGHGSSLETSLALGGEAKP